MSTLLSMEKHGRMQPSQYPTVGYTASLRKRQSLLIRLINELGIVPYRTR